MEELESLLNDLKLLQEDANNTLDNSYSAARKIWESLPENERLLVSPRGNYVDSPNLIKRVVINGKGFADAYKYNGKDDIAFTVVAISPNCRGQGLSKQLVTKLEGELKSKGVKKIIHRAERTNNASIGLGLAKSLGYKFDGETKHQVRFSKVLNESVWNALSLKGGPHLTLYHGSPSKQDEIKPVSLTVGNSMHDPGWAVFMFDDKRLAMAYAIGITITTTYNDWFDKNKIRAPIGWFENDKGFFKYKPVNIVDETTYDKIVSKVVGTKFYVYTLKVPIDKNLNMIGTTNTIPEYTYTGTPKVIKREEMVISKEVFDAQYAKVPHDVFEKYRAAKMAKKSLYGPWMKMFVNMDTRGTKRKLVLKTLKLEPGSDLSFLNDIIGKDDYHNNVSKWLEDKQKILYVFGLSGSGKTTMTNKLAKLLNCKVIHIDEVHHEMSKKFGKNWKNGSLSQQQRRDIVWNEVKKRAGDDKCIIEGGAMIVYKVEDLEKKPYIIPGTSVITSTFRMLKRTLSNDPKQGLPAFFKDYEGKSKFEMLKNMIRIIYNCAKGNIDMAGKFDAYKKN